MTDAPYREHVVGRPRSSLDRVLAEPATSPGQLRAMAARAWRAHGVVLFQAADLRAMPDFARAMVEAEARRLYGVREARR